jgi:hypothetical protein
MDFADTGLVRPGERGRIRRIFTIDRREVEIYRTRRLRHFDILL